MSDRRSPPPTALSPTNPPAADLRSKSEAILGRMQVLDSRGNRVGTVDRVLPSDEIKLTRRDSPDGLHHYIPLDWVAESTAASVSKNVARKSSATAHDALQYKSTIR